MEGSVVSPDSHSEKGPVNPESDPEKVQESFIESLEDEKASETLKNPTLPTIKDAPLTNLNKEESGESKEAPPPHSQTSPQP